MVKYCFYAKIVRGRRLAVGGTDERQHELLYSARTLQDVIYRAQLTRSTDGVRFDVALTRAWPSDWTGLTGRVESEAIQRLTFGVSERPWIYICGPTGFVESVSDSMVAAGHPPEKIKTERFGPSGGGTP